MTSTTPNLQTLRDSAGIRWMVLLFLAFAMFCSYIFMDILSPIKDLMQSTRGWDSTGNLFECICILPYLCGYHPGQDGSAFHGSSFGSGNAGRCNNQLVCCD